MLLGVFRFCVGESRAVLPAHSPSASAEAYSAEIVVSSNSTTNSLPAVAHNSDGDEFLVVWTSEQTEGYDIRGQRVGANGVLVGQNLTVTAPFSATWPRLPAVAYNPSREEYLVVWSDGTSGLRGQRVLSDGVLAGSCFTISTPLNNDPHSPALLYAPERDLFLLAWRGCLQNQASAPQAPGGGALCYTYAQILDGVGADVSENITATSSTPWQTYPALAYVPESEQFWILWASQYEIVAQRILTTGLLIGEPFSVTQGTAEMSNASISSPSGRGEFLVAWERARQQGYQLGPAGGGYHDIYAQRVLSSGVPVGDSFPVSSLTGTALGPRAVQLSEHDRFFVLWQETDVADVDHDLYARWMTAAGELVGPAYSVAVAPQYQGEAAAAGNSTAFVVWRDDRGGPDIRGRLLREPSTAYLPLVARGAEIGSYPFVMGPYSPMYTYNFANADGCNWLGVAGQVLDLDGAPVPGDAYMVWVTEGGMNSQTFTGHAPAYGPSGWEVYLYHEPRVETHRIQLFTPTGTPVSGVYEFTTRDGCDENLVVINFLQDR